MLSENKNVPGENPLGVQPIKKLLLKFSVPAVLSMIVSALYNIVDQIFIGQGVGYLGNAATNVVYPYTVIALAFALLIGDGCGALFSLSLGKKDYDAVHKSVGNSIIALLFFGVVLTAIGFLFIEPLLDLFAVTESSYQYAKEYMTIILIGIPAYMLTAGLNAAIRSDGSPGYSMIANVTGAVLNCILDPIAIFVLDWGVAGAAIATIFSQYVSCVITLLYFRKLKTFTLIKKSFLPNIKLIGEICSLGISSFITQIAIVITVAVTNNIFVTYGMASIYGADIPLSTMGIVMKVYGIVIAIVVGISIGGQPICGYNYGAGKFNRVLETYKYVLFAVSVCGIISMLLFEFFPQYIIRIFGSESDLYNEFATLCFRIYLGGILLCCIQKASSIFLQSIGRPIKALLLSISRDIIFLIPLVILLPRHFGVVGTLWSAPISDVLTIILTVILILIEYRKIKKLEKAGRNENI